MKSGMLHVLGDIPAAPPVNCRMEEVVLWQPRSPWAISSAPSPQRFFWEQACPKVHFSGELWAWGTQLSAVAPAESRLTTPILSNSIQKKVPRSARPLSLRCKGLTLQTSLCKEAGGGFLNPGPQSTYCVVHTAQMVVVSSQVRGAEIRRFQCPLSGLSR